MDHVEAEENIRVIRDVMERSARYTSFTGLSGVIAGLLAFAGCAVTYWISDNVPRRAMDACYLATWLTVLFLAFGQDVALAQRNARSRGETIWNPATYQVLKSVVPGVFVALILSLHALALHDYESIPAIWSLGYGAAVCAAGRFSVREVKIFGAIQLVSGAVGLLAITEWISSLLFLAMTFGVYHMVFGIVLMRKYGR